MAVLLAVFLWTIGSTASVFASGTEIDFHASGSVSVTLRDRQTQTAVSGGEMTLYQVAKAAEESGKLYWEYTNGFEDCKVNLSNPDDSKLAESLESEISAAASKTVKEIGADGKVSFTNLPLGLYLLVQNKAADGYRAVSSFLVSVPFQNDSGWSYDVDASPKVDTASAVTPGTPGSSYRPSSGGGSRLPQTGQLNWPIPVLAVSGMLSFILGWFLCRGKNQDEA